MISIRPLFGDFLFFIRNSKKKVWAGGSLPLSIILLASSQNLLDLYSISYSFSAQWHLRCCWTLLNEAQLISTAIVIYCSDQAFNYKMFIWRHRWLTAYIWWSIKHFLAPWWLDANLNWLAHLILKIYSYK